MKISIQRHLRSLMRDEFYRNWLIAIVVFVLVLIVVLIVAALTQDMEGALVAVLRSGTPSPSFPLAWHIWLGMLNTILITPFLLAAIIMTIRYWTERIQTGRKRYKSIKNHYVLIGYNRYSVSIIRNRLGQDGDSDALMILYTVAPPQTVRSELRALLPKALEERVIIYAGAPHLKEQIAQLNLHTAKAVYIALDGEDWNSSYARNISMLQTIAHYAGTQRVENHLPVMCFSMMIRLTRLHNDWNCLCNVPAYMMQTVSWCKIWMCTSIISMRIGRDCFGVIPDSRRRTAAIIMTDWISNHWRERIILYILSL
ncbi:MAG: hypothetical protein IJ718_03400 [Paludibacteraceae bacterium]|nr:hypothetical protein [Paludibacteraceae bacterium]